MNETPPRSPVLLADYRPSAFECEEIELLFKLDPDATIVEARQVLVRKGDASAPLLLDGEDLHTHRVALGGRELEPHEYEISDTRLTLRDLPERFSLETTVRIDPRANTQLSGLYISSDMFCTQCEAEGFRRITWFQDRPDIMTRYRVRIEADAARYPVLLCNGNLLERGELPERGALGEGRHYALWEDPFKKPSYLFALVAGDLSLLEDRFTTRSGREVALKLYSEAAFIDQCRWAMDALKRSMRWDEERYSLEYDLDLFMIVAVSDFNFGAMENKGLNIFNVSACLARADTATDADFMTVERIIAHEYFHNWTGNRITCRDWFQLTLKEGLTVFRDQQFVADMHSAPVRRIGDVSLLRETQFPEDAGPLAHPIRPQSFVEINNLYTRTVYEKGAEVIRMVHTLLGEEDYRKGIDLYVQRHDGHAVTCEDFLAAMGDASGRDLGQFKRWYDRAGTPEVRVERRHDPSTSTLTLDLEQFSPKAEAEQPEPLVIPLRVGLIGSHSGRELPVTLQGENEDGPSTRVIELDQTRKRVVFSGLDEEPIPSLLRDFSAPIRLEMAQSDEELAFMLAHDADAFARWDAGQALLTRLLLARVESVASSQRGELDGDGLANLELGASLTAAMERVLDDAPHDPAFAARALSLPGRSFIAQRMGQIEVEALARGFRDVRLALGSALAPRWLEAYEAMHAETQGELDLDPMSMGRRSLKNVVLGWLLQGQVARAEELAGAQYRTASSMTDKVGALRAVCDAEAPTRDALLKHFYEQWREEPLVVNKWLSLQASMEDERSIERVQQLMSHTSFNLNNPNRVRALLGTFASANLEGFHRRDGAGYSFLADQVLELDGRNPQVAARLATAFGRWRRFDPHRQELMRGALQRMLEKPSLSKDTYEIAHRSLG